MKGHTVHLQEVQHPLYRLHKPEVLLQEGQDRPLQKEKLPVPDHQKTPPPEIKAGSNAKGINEGHVLHVHFH
jgi:hypothetical protein